MTTSADASRYPLGATRDWMAWRHFGLRSAGFPFQDLADALAEPYTAVADAAPAAEHVAADRTALSRAVALARADRVQMALLWQNARIPASVVPWLAGRLDNLPPPARRPRDWRRNELTLIKYLQRYHTKNETIGFFGPAAWGTFCEESRGLTVRPGPSLSDRQIVWFEDWAIHRLALHLAQDPEIRRQLPPALSVHAARRGRVILTRDGPLRRLDDREAAVLDLCDGLHRAAAIGAILGDEDSVLAVVTRLADEGVLWWGFDITLDMHPERALEDQLRALPRGPSVDAALAELAALCDARRAVAAADGPVALGEALSAADARYAVATGGPAARRRDSAERGRRLLVAQSHRDVDVTVGIAILDELAPALDLVLRSARWFCWRIGQEVTGWARAAFDGLVPFFGTRVPLDALYAEVMPRIRDQHSAPGVIAELAHRWTQVLPLGTREHRVTCRAADLAPIVAERFASPVPNWFAGRHHSPDLMLAATDPAQIAQGDYVAVLGEVHAGVITYDACSFNEFAPAPQILIEASELALRDGPPRFVPLYPRSGDANTAEPLTGMNYPVPDTVSSRYTYLSMGVRCGERRVPATSRLPMSAVTVQDRDGDLEAVLPDGARYPVLTVLGECVSLMTAPRFHPVPDLAHTPRVTVDRLVLVRESWRVAASDLAACLRDAELDGYRGLRQFAGVLGLPRHTFWRSLRGQKPIYLDLGSPPLARLLADAVRRLSDDPAAVVTFTEMLPAPEQLWLHDAQGRRYTSELRMTVTDNAASDLAPGQGA